MASQIIRHSCGHSVSHQLYGPGADRDRKAAWLRTQCCMACLREQETAKAAEVSTLWPVLAGTDKQVAWAMVIRAQLVTAARQWTAEQIADWTRRKAPAEKIAELRRTCETALDRAITSHTDAIWWIDHRDDSGREIIRIHATW